jgi:hypothetical protein
MPTDASRCTTHNSVEIAPKTRVGDRDAIGTCYFSATADGARQRKQHRHAVVVVTIDPTTLQPGWEDAPAIGGRFDVAAKNRKPFGDDRQAIGLLRP